MIDSLDATPTDPDFSPLDDAGLNLHAVFHLDSLPGEIRQMLQAFDETRRFRQLILIGHGGRSLWGHVKGADLPGCHPIDDYSVSRARNWFSAQWPEATYAVVYPGDAPVGLQSLGMLAGWHHETPFRVGINALWGSWFAYRVAVLADTALTPTAPMSGVSPCIACRDKPCVPACPASAMAEGDFSLIRCLDYRRQPASLCRLTCLARTGCPVRPEHRYEETQMAHSYAQSLRMIGGS